MMDRRQFLAAAALAGAAVRLRGAEEGFTPLFNGEDLTGWEGDPLLWVVEDGELIGRSPGIGYNDFLATEAEYADFVLRFQVRLVNDVGNSGVQFRSRRVPGSMEMEGYQADIGPTWWGDLYDESRRKETLVDADEQVVTRAVKKDDWNDYEIRAEKSSIALKINGVTTAEYTEEDPSVALDGRLAVQIHSGPALEVRFRDIRIQEL